MGQSKSSWAKRERRKSSIERLARVRAWVVPGARGMTAFVWRCLSVSVQDNGFLLDSCTGLAATELRGGHPAQPMYSKGVSTESLDVDELLLSLMAMVHKKR